MRSPQILATSQEVLRIETGSLYPALHRLEAQGWVVAAWETSDKGRRAKNYTLTRTGKRQLVAEQSKWEQLAPAISRCFAPAE
jgi:DNA-binding PadR family transcriptional regulator